MGRQSIKVQIEAITGEERQTVGSQVLSQGMDEPMRRMLCAGSQMEHGHELGARIDGQPEPQDLLGVAQPGAQFVQLEMREVQGTEAALMEELSVPACAREPGGDAGLSVTEDPFSGGRVQTFGQRREDHGDLMGRGFQTVQRGMEPGCERRLTGLAAKGLDPLDTTMLAIADQSVDGSVCNPVVDALPVRTGETLGGYAFGGSPSAFDLAPGAHRQRQWTRTRRGRGGETTGRAISWGARLEQTVERAAHLGSCSRRGRIVMEPAKTPQQREREQEEGHEQEHEPMNGHTDPRCLI